MNQYGSKTSLLYITNRSYHSLSALLRVLKSIFSFPFCHVSESNFADFADQIRPICRPISPVLFCALQRMVLHTMSVDVKMACYSVYMSERQATCLSSDCQRGIIFLISCGYPLEWRSYSRGNPLSWQQHKPWSCTMFLCSRHIRPMSSSPCSTLFRSDP